MNEPVSFQVRQVYCVAGLTDCSLLFDAPTARMVWFVPFRQWLFIKSCLNGRASQHEKADGRETSARMLAVNLAALYSYALVSSALFMVRHVWIYRLGCGLGMFVYSQNCTTKSISFSVSLDKLRVYWWHSFVKYLHMRKSCNCWCIQVYKIGPRSYCTGWHC